MRSMLLATVIFSLSAALPALHAAEKKKHPLLEVKKAMSGNYHSGSLPKGFTDTELSKKDRPKFTRGFLKYLSDLEAKKAKDWKKYVLETPEEFGAKTKEELKAISEDPNGQLGQRYLVEIEEVYSVSKDGELVGYVFSTADHVQAAIYQDGAGIIIYTDTKLNVVATSDWAS